MDVAAQILLIASSRMQRTPAFERAVCLAHACHCALRIIAVDYIRALEVLGLFNPQMLATLRDSYLQTHRRWLEDEAAYERTRGLDCSVHVIWSDQVLEEIRHCLATLQPSMLIKDVHHESVIKRVFSTPLDWHLLQDCECPVQLVVPSHHPLPRKILAAVNLYRNEDADLRLNDAILREATRLGRLTQATVHVLYTYDWAGIYAAGMPRLSMQPIEDGFAEALSDAHQEAFVRLCEDHAIDSRHRHFLTGTPLQTIDAFARHNDFDLLVMGTLPRHNLARIMGNTAEVVLANAPCSVLIVKA